MKAEQDISEKAVRCEDRGCVFYIPREIFAYAVLLTQHPRKRYIRYKEGAEQYSMSLRKFKQFAHDAGAVAKIDKMALVDTEALDNYIDYFKCELPS